MNHITTTPDATIALWGAAFLSFLGRTFIDYHLVMHEFGVANQDLLPITAGFLAFYGGWLWALVHATRGNRVALVAVLAFNILLILFGISTFTSFCPSPCGTAWPLGELLMWSNVLIGIPATLAAFRELRRSANQPAGALPS